MYHLISAEFLTNMWRPAQQAFLSKSGFQVGPSILPEPHARTRKVGAPAVR